MKVEINGHELLAPAGCSNLLELLESQKLGGPGCAVAIGDAVVPRAKWGDTPLSNGMKITVINAVCGG